MTTITLDNGRLRLVVNPVVGGSVVRFDRLTEHGPEPLMRPGNDAERDPNRLAMYPLVPWSNRIGGGGFTWQGRHYPLAANLAGEPLPIHGDGWQREWRVERQAQHELRLTLRSFEQPPFDYLAELSYRLADDTLEVVLAVTHRGETPAPYGLGLHPWFPRSADVRLEATAEGVWEVDADQLPTEWRRLEATESWNFSRGKGLPSGKIDNLFTGWNSRAELRWPERGVTLEVRADTSRYLVFSPGKQADFFCFEPVSHGVDAHRFADSPTQGLTSEGSGLVSLKEGERCEMCCHFRCHPAD
ncbi:aldose 1-epimerase [Halomonas daqingensis]|uniref:Aldose 1-epimerase n=1 Tax=Billgrantia desiderata TaxID=52021 RepID=A0ABS9BBC5_9GAMM|nr:aldose 1-epimerase [Halomonas desiderata]MCE8044980.1 aldose 1-epimerase [Halomonas desiderata]MCE8049548.1 aldose 1-epimerase [Halomonas desiderata]